MAVRRLFAVVTVPVVPIPIVVSISIMLAVSVAIVLAVSISSTIPMMIMLNSAAVSAPITRKELLSFVVWCYPIGSFVRRSSPIAIVPPVMPSYWIPISFHPYELLPWSRGLNVNRPRWRRCSNRNTNRDLCMCY
jgi:hypothetical protein